MDNITAQLDRDAFRQAAIFGTIGLSILAVIGAIPIINIIVCCLIIPAWGLVGAAYPYFSRQDGVANDIVTSSLFGALTAAVASIIPSVIGTVLSFLFAALFDSDSNAAFGVVCAPIAWVLTALFAGIIGAVGAALYSALSNR